MVRVFEVVAGRKAIGWCVVTVLFCALAQVTPLRASSLSEKAKESKCVDRPVAKGGELYTCSTQSGVITYFNVPGANGTPARDRGSRRSSASPSPASFPRVDGGTQKARDDMRRKVLSDELAAEQKLLAEARGAYADGAPPLLPGELANAEKYRARIGKLRQTVAVHERNVEALNKELALVK